jgi:hypothetical protein
MQFEDTKSGNRSLKFSDEVGDKLKVVRVGEDFFVSVNGKTEVRLNFIQMDQFAAALITEACEVEEE